MVQILRRCQLPVVNDVSLFLISGRADAKWPCHSNLIQRFRSQAVEMYANIPFFPDTDFTRYPGSFLERKNQFLFFFQANY